LFLDNYQIYVYIILLGSRLRVVVTSSLEGSGESRIYGEGRAHFFLLLLPPLLLFFFLLSSFFLFSFMTQIRWGLQWTSWGVGGSSPHAGSTPA
jgi:hypothetical protein